jgi:hypothetical protein
MSQIPAWRGNDSSPEEVARVAVRRLLYLQTQTRRAVLLRHREAAALLARSAVDACITGLYCLYADDAVERLRRDSGKSVKGILSPLGDPSIITPDFIKAVADDVTGSVGEGRKLPKIRQMAEHVVKESGEQAALTLYDTVYGPVSTLFAHSYAFALLRHVGRDNTLLSRPLYAWTPRAALNATDACVGLLAWALAGHVGSPRDEFREYADAHWLRVLDPMTAVGARDLSRQVQWRKLPEAWRIAREGNAYYTSDEARTDSPELAAERIREIFRAAYSAVLPNAPAAELNVVIGALVSVLVTSLTASNTESPEPPHSLG